MPVPSRHPSDAPAASSPLNRIHWAWLGVVIGAHAAGIVAFAEAIGEASQVHNVPAEPLVLTVRLLAPPATHAAEAPPPAAPTVPPAAAQAARPPEPKLPRPISKPAATSPAASTIRPDPPQPSRPALAPEPEPNSAPATESPTPHPLPARLPTGGATPSASAPPPAAEPLPSAPARFDAAYLRNPAPDYPRVSRRRGEEGRVLLRVHVLSSGLPDHVEIVQSSGHPRLDQAAHDTVWHWRFTPAQRGDIAIDSWLQVPIEFRLED